MEIMSSKAVELTESELGYIIAPVEAAERIVNSLRVEYRQKNDSSHQGESRMYYECYQCKKTVTEMRRFTLGPFVKVPVCMDCTRIKLEERRKLQEDEERGILRAGKAYDRVDV